MKLTIHQTKGALEIEDFDRGSVLDLKVELNSQQRFLTLEMDEATVLVNRDHIMRIDIED